MVITRGKYAQKSDQRQTVFVGTYEELMALHHSPGVNEPDYTLIGSEDKGVMLASYQPNPDVVDSAPYTNVVIASFTTAQARLQLLEALEAVGSDAFYCDTDSIFYLTRDNVDPLSAKTGNYLGEFTNELEEYGEGAFIDQFCSGGAEKLFLSC